MLKRRTFLRNSATAALGSLLLTRQGNAFDINARSYPIGLQLYTLANAIEEDLQGTLRKVASIGYKEVESAFGKKSGYYGLKPREFKTAVQDAGLSWQSHHVSGAPSKSESGEPELNLKENSQRLVDEAAAGGVRYLVCAGAPMDSLDNIRGSIEMLNKTSEACRKAGIRLAYHNHEREFHEVEDEQPYHLLLSQTDPENLQMELDLAWATKAGFDPIQLFKKYPGRFPLWHVKDISKDMNTLEPIGEGSIDFIRIFANAKTAGLKYFFVEHDNPQDPFGSITTSFNKVSEILKLKIRS